MKKEVVLGLLVMGWSILPAEAGTLSGSVRLGVAPPPVKPIKIEKDTEVCGTERKSEKLMLSKEKGIANAVIILKGVTGTKGFDPKGPATSKKIEFVQEKCQFKPHVLIIPKGATIDVVNNDPITHNIHTFPKENPPLNKAQPASLKRFTTPPFDAAETIKVQCDIHRGLMSAWFVVADTPYTAVSDANGTFAISDLPDGTYTAEIWHEALGKTTKEVTIKGGTGKLDLSLSPKKKEG